MPIKFIRTLRHQVELGGIFSQPGVVVAGVYVEGEYSLLLGYEKLDSPVNEIAEDLLDVDVPMVEYYSV